MKSIHSNFPRLRVGYNKLKVNKCSLICTAVRCRIIQQLLQFRPRNDNFGAKIEFIIISCIRKA